MRTLRLGLLGCLFAFAVAGPAYADFISAGAAGSGTSSPGPLTGTENAHLTAPPVITSGGGQNDNVTGPGNLNTVSFSLDVFALGAPFAIDFITSGTPPGAAAEYFFTVGITNMLGVNGVDPGDAGKEIGPIDIKILPGALFPFPPVGPVFDPTLDPLPTAAPFPYAVNLNSPTFLRFGGNAGGGGAIPFLATNTFTFSIDIPQTASPHIFSLQFTANPEPGSLVLCALLGVPALSLLRRRRKSVTTDVADLAQVAG